MTARTRATRAGLFLIPVLLLTGPARADAAAPFGAGNLGRVSRFLSDSAAGGARLDDYYFVLIGDIQNSVRDFRHDVFNALARDIREAVDDKTDERLYDRIRFVVLTGDLVYEGPSPRQWEALERAFAGHGPDGTPYPYIEMLAKDKPIIPVIGNHELLNFRPYFQTRYKDLFDSPKGAVNFKKFFDWDGWIADPHILYPVPADLPATGFREILASLPDAADRGFLSTEYLFKSDGRYHLGFYEHPPRDADEFKRKSEGLASGLAPIFRKAGYGTLPVLNSDNMIDYAFEAGGVVYLVLDSMARGWHYPGFARLKQALYPEKKDQQRLNLFTPSPFNGQSVFYRAVAAYARQNGRTLVPIMHSPTFNSSRSIYQTGVGYNTWLALGLPQGQDEQADPTIFDDILFADAPVLFGACVHAYEHLTVVARGPGRPVHTLECYVSGGGGGPLRKDFLPGKVRQAADLYNRKLEEADGRSIEIAEDTTGVGHHYLLVHVVGGRIVGATPHFLDPKDLRRPTFQPQVTLSAATESRPASTGASLEFSPGAWGIEGVVRYLTFINWRPTVSVGIVNYNTWGTDADVQAYAFTLEVSPLNLECHLPRANVVTLRLPGFEVWDGRGSLRRYFMTMGVEAPLLYDLFGTLERFRFGIKAYVPLNLGGGYDPDFGRRTRLALSVGYRFRL